MSTVTGKPGKDSDLGEMERQAANRNAAGTQRMAEKAHQTIDRVADVASEAEQTMRSTASRAAEKVKVSEEKAAQAIDESMEKVRSYVEKNPLASAGIAFAAGLLVSVLIRR